MALHVGVKTFAQYTMSTDGSLIPILVLPRCTFGHFGTYYVYVNRHYLVQFLITDLKQNKRNNKKKSRQVTSYLKRSLITRIKPYKARLSSVYISSVPSPQEGLGELIPPKPSSKPPKIEM